MARPFATVLIDTYNHESFIAEAISSVLGQDFPSAESEILVVDDGSTDGSAALAKSAGATVFRHEQNLGKGAAGQAVQNFNGMQGHPETAGLL